MDIPLIISKIRPNSSWSMNGETLKDLVWNDEGPRPTDKEIKDAWEEIKLNFNNEKNKRLRLQAYREESDPLFFKYQRGEVEKQEWLDKVQEIKERFSFTASSQQ
jgi:hypothetical protein